MNKKGFTLIELLAVIVILAVIALIAVPVVLNVIEKAKEGSAVDSAYGYIHAIENSVALREIKDKEVVNNGTYEDLRGFENTNKVGIKGSIPSSGYFKLEKRQVVEAEFIINGYKVICDKRICRIGGMAEKITITYELNGGTLNKTEDVIYKGSSMVLPSPTRLNYEFDAWYTESTFENKVTNKTVFNGDTTLYAHWEKGKHTIVFNGNGGTPEENSMLVDHEGKLETPSAERVGYTFNGWYTEREAGDLVTNDTIWTENKTVYAHWTINSYTLTLENAKFSDNTTTKTLNYNTEVEIIAVIPSDVVDTNYSGNTSCSSSSDVGNIKYKLNHSYSVKDWNVSNTSNTTITYKVPAENKTVKPNFKDTTSQTNKYECKSEDASYSSGYYYCNSGDGSPSGNTCTKTVTPTSCTYTKSVTTTWNSDQPSSYTARYTCSNGRATISSCSLSYKSYSFNCSSASQCSSTSTSLNVCSCSSSFGSYYNCASVTKGPKMSASESCSCPTTTETYTASYSSGYYYCSSGTQDGSKCYVMRSIS